MASPAGKYESPWRVETELLAQLVEVMSVLASERRLKKPLEVPRPDSVTREPEPTTDPSTVTPATTGKVVGHLAVAAMFAGQGKVRASGPNPVGPS